MSFQSYSVSLSNIYDASFHKQSECYTIAETYKRIVEYLRRNHSGDVITVFYMDTEDGPCDVEYSAFNAADGWTFSDHLLDNFTVHICKSWFDTYYRVCNSSYEGYWPVYEHPSFFICCNEAIALSEGDCECAFHIEEVTNNRLACEINEFSTGIVFCDGCLY